MFLQPKERLVYMSSRRVRSLSTSPTGVQRLYLFFSLINMVGLLFTITPSRNSNDFLCRLLFYYVLSLFYIFILFSGKLADVVLGYDSVKDYMVSFFSLIKQIALCFYLSFWHALCWSSFKRIHNIGVFSLSHPLPPEIK